MSTNILNKGFAFGIILLFIGISCSSTITAVEIQGLSTLNHSRDRTPVRLLYFEYKPDGTIQKNTILLPRSEYLKMRQFLSLSTSIEEKLEVYEEYGIIPSNITIQKMKEKFDLYLRTKNIDMTATQNHVFPRKNIFGLVLNLNCKINVMGRLGIHFNLGMSAITQFLNFIAICLWNGSGSPSFIQGGDLCDFFCSIMGDIDVSEGIFQDYTSTLAPMILIMLGFVGYFIVDLPLPFFHNGAEYLGYAACILAIGIRYSPE